VRCPVIDWLSFAGHTLSWFKKYWRSPDGTVVTAKGSSNN
jgi:hypothetical protein